VDAEGPDDVRLLVILTVHSTAEKSTANLLGPLVVNSTTGQALQAVLSGSGHSPATPIVNRP
jgi:flagellar assembly factor FliW